MPDPVVVDTSVLSLFLKRDTRAAAYQPHLAGREAIVSFITVAELYRWPILRNWGAARTADLERYLEAFTIHYVDDRLCRVWAQITAEAQLRGHPLPLADCWIAATALRAGLALVTHNPRDVTSIPGLQVITEAP
jgi:predicted nucleic acid-binding protein